MKIANNRYRYSSMGTSGSYKVISARASSACLSVYSFVCATVNSVVRDVFSCASDRRVSLLRRVECNVESGTS